MTKRKCVKPYNKYVYFRDELNLWTLSDKSQIYHQMRDQHYSLLLWFVWIFPPIIAWKFYRRIHSIWFRMKRNFNELLTVIDVTTTSPAAEKYKANEMQTIFVIIDKFTISYLLFLIKLKQKRFCPPCRVAFSSKIFHMWHEFHEFRVTFIIECIELVPSGLNFISLFCWTKKVYKRIQSQSNNIVLVYAYYI